MTYYDSAEGLRVTLPRCMQELKRHGIDPSSEWSVFPNGRPMTAAEAFMLEVWCDLAVFNHGDASPSDTGHRTVEATHLLDWLGY